MLFFAQYKEQYQNGNRNLKQRLNLYGFYAEGFPCNIMKNVKWCSILKQKQNFKSFQNLDYFLKFKNMKPKWIVMLDNNASMNFLIVLTLIAHHLKKIYFNWSFTFLFLLINFYLFKINYTHNKIKVIVILV